MKLIVGKRQTGKTIEAIMTSHATGATILCANEARKVFTKQEAERLQRSIPDPLTIADLRRYGRPVRPILIIDDLEAILEGILERDLECQVLAAYMSVTNILEPIEEEQEKQKQADEIKVGDEVQSYDTRYIVVRIRDNGTFEAIGACGTDEGLDLSKFHKTGRHFDEIEKIMKQMKGNTE